MMSIHEVRFCYSPEWKRPIMPLAGVDKEFIDARRGELESCYLELNKKMHSTDLRLNDSWHEMFIINSVLVQLNSYRAELEHANYELIGKDVFDDKRDFVPFTARHGKIRKRVEK